MEYWFEGGIVNIVIAPQQNAEAGDIHVVADLNPAFAAEETPKPKDAMVSNADLLRTGNKRSSHHAGVFSDLHSTGTQVRVAHCMEWNSVHYHVEPGSPEMRADLPPSP